MVTTHPGKVLLNQYLAVKNISQNKLARALGVPPRRINEIILGKRAITADTAVRLAGYFGNSAGYWMHLQAEYDIRLAREKLGAELNRIRPRLEPPAAAELPEPGPKQAIRRRIMR